MSDYKDIKYKNNFLKEVICRVDFAPILEISDRVPVDFQNAIKGTFPKYEKKTVHQFKTEIAGAGKIKTERIDEFPIHYFSNKNQTQRVTLFYEHIIIQFLEYNHYPAFKEITHNIINSFVKIYQPGAYSRLGLRYINEITLKSGNPFNWENYIDKKLTYVLDKFLDNKENVARCMNQIILNYDDYKLNFTYGIFNSEFPSKIGRKEFTLDFDCYTEDFQHDNIFEHLLKFNSEIKRMFEKSIKDKLRLKMEIIDE